MTRSAVASDGNSDRDPVLDPGRRYWLYRWRSPQLLAGSACCAAMLAGGRWGAHLGVPPFYLGDLLLAVAILHQVVSSMCAGRRPRTGIARRGHPGLALGLLLAWTLVRFAIGGSSALDALRDLAPYAYAVVAFLAASAYARSTPDDRARTVKLLQVVLLAHLLWVLPAQLAGRTAGNELLTVRSDTDGTVLAFTACLFLCRYLQHGSLRRLLVVAGALGTMFTLSSRAVVLAALVGLAITLWCYFHRNDHGRPRRQVAAAGVAPIALLALVVVLPYTPAGSKLLAGVGIGPADSSLQQAGLGTQQARATTWRQVFRYTSETAGRQLAGVGFGPNFMIDSGASMILLQRDAEDVRSPHNYLVGTYARLGLIGVVLLSFIVIQLLAGMWRVRRFAAGDDLVLLATIVPTMLLVAASFGVVLEAPFGAIPFFWFLGILLAKPLPPAPQPTIEEPKPAVLAGVL